MKNIILSICLFGFVISANSQINIDILDIFENYNENYQFSNIWMPNYRDSLKKVKSRTDVFESYNDTVKNNVRNEIFNYIEFDTLGFFKKWVKSGSYIYNHRSFLCDTFEFFEFNYSKSKDTLNLIRKHANIMYYSFVAPDICKEIEYKKIFYDNKSSTNRILKEECYSIYGLEYSIIYIYDKYYLIQKSYNFTKNIHEKINIYYNYVYW